MMLVALILAQSANLNVQPIEVRQDGAKVPARQRQYVVDCRTNMTCAVDGGILFLSSTGSSGGGYDGGKVAEAYAADAAIYANQLAANPTDCASGQFATGIDQSGNLSCGTPDSGTYMAIPIADGGSIPMRPWAYENNLGFGIPLLPIPIGTSDVVPCRYVVSNGFELTSSSANGLIVSILGSQATVTWASTNLFTRTPQLRYATAGSVNSATGTRALADHAWRGSSAGQGGFLFWTRIAIDTSVATQRWFVGLKDATGSLTAASDPNVQLDTIYFGANSADSNFSICSNDNSGTATCTDLGTSFPTKTVGAAYDMWLWAAPNASSISYAISRIDSSASTYGTVSSDLPRNTVALGFDVWLGNGNTASSARFFWTAVVVCSNL